MLDSWAVSHIGSAITREGMHEMGFAVTTALPADWRTGRFVGRVDRGGGPCVILIRDGRATDIPRTYPTVSDRQSVVSGKSVSVRVELGGGRIIKKKKTQKTR